MPGSGLTHVLSGYLCRPQTANIRPFWLGLIKSQRDLPAEKSVKYIVANSWNPELAGLECNVFASLVDRCDDQECIQSEFIQHIEPCNHFEEGVSRLESAWKGEAIQAVFCEVRSRKRSICSLVLSPGLEVLT